MSKRGLMLVNLARENEGAAAKLVRKSLEEQRKKLRLQLQSERKRTTSACSSVAPSLSASDNQYLSSNGYPWEQQPHPAVGQSLQTDKNSVTGSIRLVDYDYTPSRGSSNTSRTSGTRASGKCLDRATVTGTLKRQLFEDDGGDKGPVVKSQKLQSLESKKVSKPGNNVYSKGSGRRILINVDSSSKKGNHSTSVPGPMTKPPLKRGSVPLDCETSPPSLRTPLILSSGADISSPKRAIASTSVYQQGSKQQNLIDSFIAEDVESCCRTRAFDVSILSRSSRQRDHDDCQPTSAAGPNEILNISASNSSDEIILSSIIIATPPNAECAETSKDNIESVNHEGNTSSCNQPSMTKEQTISSPDSSRPCHPVGDSPSDSVNISAMSAKNHSSEIEVCLSNHTQLFSSDSLMCSGTTVSKSHPEFVVPADSQQDVEEAADDAHVSSLVENLEVESTSRSGLGSSRSSFVTMSFRDDFACAEFYLDDEDAGGSAENLDEEQTSIVMTAVEDTANAADLMIDWDALDATVEAAPEGDLMQSDERDGATETPQIPIQRRTRVDAPRKNAKKRVVQPTEWKVSVAKKALNSGEAYTTKKGINKPARVMGPGCGEKCNRCARRFSPEERKAIFDTFWGLADHQRQLDYIASRVTSVSPQKKYAEPGKQGCSIVRLYRFKIQGNDPKKHGDIRVCKKMFMDTLAINDSWIKTATNGEPGCAPIDQRGRHTKRGNKVPDEIKDSVRRHINMVPKIESHYTRARSKRLYVEDGNNVEELYRKYQEWCKEEGISKIASTSMYRKIHNEEFNIGTFQPKSNLCLECSRWRHATTEEKMELEPSHRIHLENKEISQNFKTADRLKVQAQTDGETTCVISYDMQKTMTIPKSQVATFYYKSKVSLNNFSVFDMGPKVGYCFMWNETMGKKGANEVASCGYYFITMKKGKNPECVEIIVYSDNPTSQNKNRMVFSMYGLVSVKLNVKIVHRFLEMGHTHMEVDSMHAAIERSSNKKEIFDQQEWYKYILDAKKNAPDNNPAQKYEIIEVGKDVEILDFKKLVACQNWSVDTNKQKVKWTKVKEIHFDPATPHLVRLKYEYRGEFITINTTKRGRPVNLKTYQPPSAYMSRFPLPRDKINDLQSVMDCGAIPSKYHNFYEELFSVGADDEPNHEDGGCGEDCICCEDADDPENDREED